MMNDAMRVSGDFADRAAAETENELALLLMQQRSQRKPGLTPMGACHYCNEPFFAGQTPLYPQADKKLFCDSDCCQDFEANAKNHRD